MITAALRKIIIDGAGTALPIEFADEMVWVESIPQNPKYPQILLHVGTSVPHEYISNTFRDTVDIFIYDDGVKDSAGRRSYRRSADVVSDLIEFIHRPLLSWNEGWLRSVQIRQTRYNIDKIRVFNAMNWVDNKSQVITYIVVTQVEYHTIRMR